jgi:hypothetical protein
MSAALETNATLNFEGMGKQLWTITHAQTHTHTDTHAHTHKHNAQTRLATLSLGCKPLSTASGAYQFLIGRPVTQFSVVRSHLFHAPLCAICVCMSTVFVFLFAEGPPERSTWSFCVNHIGPLGATALGEAQKANTITGHLSLQGIRQSVAAQSGRTCQSIPRSRDHHVHVTAPE